MLNVVSFQDYLFAFSTLSFSLANQNNYRTVISRDVSKPIPSEKVVFLETRSPGKEEGMVCCQISLLAES